jgi:pyridoxamine 5'-phosphate oxidase
VLGDLTGLMSLSNLRRDYPGEPLLEEEAGGDPLALFRRWFEAILSLELDPTAMSLATATVSGQPSLRTVLLKDFDERGFVWYTNYGSRKAVDLTANPHASLLFSWKSLNRQVRIDGAVERISREESDAYFSSRPFESRVSVYASRQGARVESRLVLDKAFAREVERFKDGLIPCPVWWGGYRVVPDEFEFWQGRLNRMHDRLHYIRQSDKRWSLERLSP